jgi:hypothetical protein
VRVCMRQVVRRLEADAEAAAVAMQQDHEILVQQLKAEQQAALAEVCFVKKGAAKM